MSMGWGSCQYDEDCELFYQLQNENLEDIIKKYHLPKQITMVKKFEKANSGLLNIEEFLKMQRDNSWDLWSATNYLWDKLFPNKYLELDEGNTTALMCWMLINFHGVSDEECFSGWDT